MKIFKYIFSITNNLDKKIFRILGLKLTFSRFKAQRIKSLNNKPTIALQLNQMDKGGLEEVVLQIATNNKIRRQYNIVIICEYTNKGYLANIAKKYKIPVYSFFSNTKNIPQFVKTLNIKIAHFHYNVTGIDKYKKLGVKTLYTIHNNYIWSDSKEVAERKTYYQYIDKFIAV